MRKIVKFAGLIVLSVIFLGCNQSAQKDFVQEQPNNEEVKKMINEKNAKISAFYNKGLADSVASFFAKNSIQMVPNQDPLIGVEKIKESWGQSMQFGTWSFNLSAEEVKGCGDMIVELGKYTLDFQPNENSPIPQMTDKGNYLVLWEKIDGKWKIVWDAPVSEVPFPSKEIENITEE